LFAPWRLEYIIGKREEGCIFCKKPAQRESLRDNLVLYLGKTAFVIMNRYPYTPGHLLVCPFRHTSDFVSLTAEETLETSSLLQGCMRILGELYHPEGFNLGMNLGVSAGAGIREHLHWHIVPRWYGDTNFLPVLSGTRSIPEMLIESYDRLRPEFERLEGGGTAARDEGGESS